MNHEKYIDLAIKEAKKAYKKGDIPVGVIIVKNNKIIAKAYNKKEKDKIATEHAEIIAIRKACKKLKTWHLNDCILYSTMEPCMMCKGAIIESRIKKIVCSVPNEKYNSIEKNIKLDITMDIRKEEYLKILRSFFQNKRK